MPMGFWTMLWHTTFLRHKAEKTFTFINHYQMASIEETMYKCECGQRWWN